jgi:hypothetical protein
MAKKAVKSATTAEIAGHGRVLTPGRYVGADGTNVQSQMHAITSRPARGHPAREIQKWVVWNLNEEV